MPAIEPYYRLGEYLHWRGMVVPPDEIRPIAFALCDLTTRLGLEVEKASHPVHGRVNSYPLVVLEEWRCGYLAEKKHVAAEKKARERRWRNAQRQVRDRAAQTKQCSLAFADDPTDGLDAWRATPPWVDLP
jgi:hypothetical protein